MQRLAFFLAALWWGSLTAVGFIAVPMLFMHLETPAMAGNMAAKLFTAQSWISVVCGLLLLMSARRLHQNNSYAPSPWVIGGVLCALLLELAVKPHIMARDNLMLWHNLGTALFAMLWGCAGKTLWDVYPMHSEVDFATNADAQD